MQSFISRIGLGISLGCCAFLVGCAQTAAASQNTASSSAVAVAECQKNTFLQRYGCSLERVERAAETNDPDAEYALGYMYYNGIGTVRDPDTAVVWIKRAAQQGQPLAISAMTAIRRAQFPKIGQVHVHQKAPTAHKPATQPLSQPVSVHKATKPLPRAQSVEQAARATTQAVTLHQRSAISTLPPHNYSVQLFASYHLPSVQHYIHQLPATMPYYIVSQLRQNKPMYILLAGNFKTRADAAHYVHTLTHAQQATHPWIRQIGQIKGHQT
jgi:hypothetical protein